MAKVDYLDKAAIVAEYRINDADTGSTEVQVALLTARIAHITEHLKTNRKDFNSRRGLIKMTSQRRALLNYLKANDEGRYNDLIKRLNLRR